MSLKKKPKETKGYNKDHDAQDGVKLLDLMRSIVYGVEDHLQVKMGHDEGRKAPLHIIPVDEQ